MFRGRRSSPPARRRRPVAIALALLPTLLPAILAGCLPRVVAGSLGPTLSLQTVPGGVVAMQNGIAVPTFGTQPRPRIDLDGSWRLQRATFDANLSLGDRGAAIDGIVAEARGRQAPTFDDASWAVTSVPGSFDPPPATTGGGAWYRRSFNVPWAWRGQTATLKFDAVQYLADVWLNGHYLGYHEGGFTPFAFDAGSALIPGGVNVLAVRVDDPTWGTRNDIVPWGLADWWDYGGITQSVWLEATPALSVARADVVPHLDGADVTVVAQNRGAGATRATVSIQILPAFVDAANLLDPDPRSLVPRSALPIATKELDPQDVGPGGVALAQASFVFERRDNWRLDRPALYVLHVKVTGDTGTTDDFYDTFGLRHIAVDPDFPRLLFNGTPATFSGVAIHDEVLAPGGPLGARGANPISQPAQALRQLLEARKVHATLIRTGHTPADPMLLMLADRLGFAVWEEIPLYHFTPLTFGITMGRGIPQQMLREMTLRDMNHPSVMFYGLANESTGGSERATALGQLRDITRQLDGTRLTGQAAYGWDTTDSSSDPLDVAGYTFYFGVFYGSDTVSATRDALAAAHARYPTKPIMILEYGRWSDPPDGLAAQARVLRETAGQFAVASADRPGGFVAASVWWTLEDYFTLRPGLQLERFGLFAPDGSERPAAQAAREAFVTSSVATTPQSALPVVVSSGRARSIDTTGGSLRFVGYLLYGLAVCVAFLGAMLGFSLLLERLRRPPRGEALQRGAGRW